MGPRSIGSFVTSGATLDATAAAARCVQYSIKSIESFQVATLPLGVFIPLIHPELNLLLSLIKVMFLHASVILFTGPACPLSCMLPCHAHPSAMHAPHPTTIWSMSGRYASYWNASSNQKIYRLGIGGSKRIVRDASPFQFLSFHAVFGKKQTQGLVPPSRLSEFLISQS